MQFETTGNGPADDLHFEHGNITEGSFLLDDVVVVPPTTKIPANTAFANDATRVVQNFSLGLVENHRMQVAAEYERTIRIMNELSSFLRWMDNCMTGNGDHANWNGDNLWNIYNPDGGGFSPAIHVSGRPTQVNVNSIPGQTGVLGGFRGNSRIGYISRGGSKLSLTFASDVAEISRFGLKSFSAGNQFTAATEAVVGKGTDESKSAVGDATSERVQKAAETGTQNLMKAEAKSSHSASLNNRNKPPVTVSSWCSGDSAGFAITRDSLSNGKVTYTKWDLNGNEERSDSSSLSRALKNW